MRLRDAVRALTRDEKLGFFGEGPWVDEPDRVEFKAHGLPCLILRHRALGTLCGYVAVGPEHPLYGRSMLEVERELDVHGGITYASRCAGMICHTPEPGEPDQVYWFGFDAAHYGDCVPSADGDMRERLEVRDMLDRRAGALELDDDDPTYRDVAYMRAECERLAGQLVACGRAG